MAPTPSRAPSPTPEIVFFDLETIIETEAIIEFGAIIVCPRTLEEKEYFTTLVRPPRVSDLGDFFHERASGLTREDVLQAPFFGDFADTVYDMLHGKIWVGHNIINFDKELIEEAFNDINEEAPEPLDIIDTMDLAKRYKEEVGDIKMETLTKYFKLGVQQIHRSLDDVRLNLKLFPYLISDYKLSSILKKVARDCNSMFLEPREVSTSSIRIKPFFNIPFDQVDLMHNNFPLELSCTCLNVRFGMEFKYVNDNGLPLLSFVVDAPQELCRVLEECDKKAKRRWFAISGGRSKWREVIERKGYRPTIRLRIPNPETYYIAICLKESLNGSTERLVMEKSNELLTYFTKGRIVDAFLSLQPYDYKGSAGIRLVAKKLIVHSG